MPLTASAIAGGVMAVGGKIETLVANRRLKRLASKRQARETPKEFIDANNLALNEAQSGFGASSLDYFTKQGDRALATSLETVLRLGGDPNSVGDIFDRQMQFIAKTTNDDAYIRNQKVGRVFDSIMGLGQERLANAADRELLLKDKMAAEAMKVKAGADTMNSGLNLALSSFTAMKAGDGYDTTKTKPLSTSSYQSSSAEIIRSERQPLSTTLRQRTSPNVGVNAYNNFTGPTIPSWYNQMYN